MALPPLYKYLDVDGAKKTLGNMKVIDICNAWLATVTGSPASFAGKSRACSTAVAASPAATRSGSGSDFMAPSLPDLCLSGACGANHRHCPIAEGRGDGVGRHRACEVLA